MKMGWRFGVDGGRSLKNDKTGVPKCQNQALKIAWCLAQERFRRTNYADGCMPPLVLAAKQSCIDPEKTAEILALLLAEPRVTVDPAIGALAAKFAYNSAAPLAVLKGDPRTGLDEWEVGKDPTALNLGVALAIGTF